MQPLQKEYELVWNETKLKTTMDRNLRFGLQQNIQENEDNLGMVNLYTCCEQCP